MNKDVHTFDAATFTGVISMFTGWISELSSNELCILRRTLQETDRTTASLDITARVRKFTGKVDQELESRESRATA